MIDATQVTVIQTERPQRWYERWYIWVGVGAVIGGWDKGLVGQNVGSRVLLSIPPEHGYGQRGVPQAGIAGTDTLVFVVDIVDVQ